MLWFSYLITIEDVYIGLTKFDSQKLGDLQAIKAEMLKWVRKEAHA